VGCGGGEGIVRLDFDFGAREAMGRGCGCVGAGRAACSHGWRPTASRQGLFGLISTLKNQAKFRSHFFYKKNVKYFSRLNTSQTSHINVKHFSRLNKPNKS
jgi:hypothetical protein